jgi:CAAX amino terminal protease family.
VSAAPVRVERTVGMVALGATVAQRFLPPGGRFAANLGGGATATLAARRAGVSWSALGLDRAAAGRGLRWGVAAGTALAVGVVVAGRVPRTRQHFVDERITAHDRRRATVELAARIPLETALAEELIFRGALLGIALAHRSTPAAVLTSSALFGVWHVVPTWRGIQGSAVGAIAGEGRSARVVAVAGVVGATAAAGSGFAILRLRSGSLLAPVLAHAALNMASFAVTRTATTWAATTQAATSITTAGEPPT